MVSFLKLHKSPSSQDGGALMVYPDLILRGFIPCKDFATIYPPGNIYLIVAAFGIFGKSIFAERAVSSFYYFLMSVGIYFLGLNVSRLVGFLAALLVLIALKSVAVGAHSIVGANAIAIMALLLGYYSLTAVDLFSQKRLALLAGLTSGLVFWFRLEVGAMISIALFFVFLSRETHRLIHFVTGAVLVLASLLGYFYFVGFSFAIDSLVLDVIRNGPGRSLPFILNFRLAVVLLLAASSVLIGLIVHLGKFKIDEVLLTRGMALFFLCLLPSVFQRAYKWHISYVGAPVSGLAIVSLGILAKHYNERIFTARPSRIAAVLVAIIIFVSLGFSCLRHRSDASRVFSADRWSYYTDSSSLPDLQKLVHETNSATKPGERLFVGPQDLRFINYNDSYPYYLFSDLTPATRYIEMNPGVANRPESKLSDQLRTADWVILTTSYDDWHEPNSSVIPGPEQPNEVLRESFCDYLSTGCWRLMRRCKNIQD
jgi:4-amino-4-deoxy-L-arabinose transferase-like glycosyltransferase